MPTFKVHEQVYHRIRLLKAFKFISKPLAGYPYKTNNQVYKTKSIKKIKYQSI